MRATHAALKADYGQASNGYQTDTKKLLHEKAESESEVSNLNAAVLRAKEVEQGATPQAIIQAPNNIERLQRVVSAQHQMEQELRTSHSAMWAPNGKPAEF